MKPHPSTDYIKYRDLWLQIKTSSSWGRAALFIQKLEELDFEYLDQGSYKEVFKHKKYDFVVKVSRRGLGMAYPRRPEITNVFLEPYWMDKYVMFQPKACVTEKASMHAYKILEKSLFKKGLRNFLEARDFDSVNCGTYNNKPVIIDLSYMSGYHIVESND